MARSEASSSAKREKKKRESTESAAPVLPSAKKAKKPKPIAAVAPPSIGDALKDELRQKQQKKSPVAEPATWETDEAAPFPRGGGSALTPLEFKAITKEAKEDALFEAQEESGPKPPNHAADDIDAAARTGRIGGELVKAHSLTRKLLVPGVRLLGAVSQISSDRLLLQLPNRQVGRVERAEVSDEPMAFTPPARPSDIELGDQSLDGTEKLPEDQPEPKA